MSKFIKKILIAGLDQFVRRGLRRFRGLHQGESCYIFGDGPSLKWFDLERFADRPGICSGLLPFHKHFDKLDIRYGLLIEPWLFVPDFLQRGNQHNLLYKPITQTYAASVRRHPGVDFFVHVSNCLSLTGTNVHYIFRHLPQRTDGSDLGLAAFNPFAGSFHASLSLAVMLGFTKIFLVGFDGWTIQPARALHWYETGYGTVFESTNFAREFLAAVTRWADVFTISAEGTSQNVINVSYETHTGTPPRFRENHELLDEGSMHVLASYPNYRIFPRSDER